MPNHHRLKTDPAPYDAVRRGDKNFEIRKDDRAFQAGDVVTLEHYIPGNGHAWGARPPQMPGQEKPDLTFRIGFVLRGGQYGIEPGYVGFSLLPLEKRMTQDEVNALKAAMIKEDLNHG